MEKLFSFNLQKWIDEHRHLLKPPVNNKLIWRDSDFIVMVIGGPNQRTDYHVNEGDEFFYQLEGDIHLNIIEDGKLKEVPIKQGEIMLLPPRVPHSPQRGPNTIGLVIERKRRPEELDGFQWFCKNCGTKVYEEFFALKNIEKQLAETFTRFYQNDTNCTCKTCGLKISDPALGGLKNA